jgi:uncharacterized membrane protein YdjX (TVP38/TMEM64 family)
VLAFILVPFVLFEGRVHNWTLARMHANAPASKVALAVVVLLAADIALPVPSSLVSTAAGALLGFLPGLAASILGMTVCSQIGYWLGRTSGLALAQRIVPARDLERAARYAEARGDWALAASRAVPVLAEASVLLAGVLRVRPTRFFAIALLANAGISAVYCAVGAAALQSSSFLLAFAGAVIVPAVAMRLARRQALPRIGAEKSSPRTDADQS